MNWNAIKKEVLNLGKQVGQAFIAFLTWLSQIVKYLFSTCAEEYRKYLLQEKELQKIHIINTSASNLLDYLRIIFNDKTLPSCLCSVQSIIFLDAIPVQNNIYDFKIGWTKSSFQNFKDFQLESVIEFLNIILKQNQSGFLISKIIDNGAYFVMIIRLSI